MKRVLVANRGEIAVRIMKALDEMGIESVAVFSAADAEALHVRMASKAVYIGESSPAASYLNAKSLVGKALEVRADAIHPGYGFLSESPEFARLCAGAGIAFIGPGHEVLARVSDKWAMKGFAKAAGFPVTEGMGPLASAEDAAEAAGKLGCPVIMKASRGGGGRGIRVARSPAEASAAFESCADESGVRSGGGVIYAEKYLERARHVEVQILSDGRGTVIHLGDRECSVQRRHQKLVEEAPAPGIDPKIAEAIRRAAVGIMRMAGYVNAGTVEFLLDGSGAFSFMEINPRLQVEHPVTELVTGVDLVKRQVEIASGAPLAAEPVEIRGNAVECRICAEDPAADFRPSSGRILLWSQPSGPGVRVDAGVDSGSTVPPEYDSLIAKVICHGSSRGEALARMEHALRNVKAAGVPTTAEALRMVIGNPSFKAGGMDALQARTILADFRPEAGFVWEALAAAALIEEEEGQVPDRVNGNGQFLSPWKALGKWRLGRRPE